MTILHDAPNPAPHPRRVRIYLAEKGISVPLAPLSIVAGEHKSPAFVAKYPPGQVPVLELDDGTMLGESVSICRYFENLHPHPPLFGTGALEMAQVDGWIRRAEFTLMMPVGQVWRHAHPFTARVVKPQYTAFGESNRAPALAAMRRIDGVLASQSANGGFLAGSGFSMADITLLSIVDFAIFIGIPLPDDVPALADWHTRMSARPSASA